ncbi:TPA: hypothetical protein ACGCF2_000201 [Stenotrophomonas maltophilia]
MKPEELEQRIRQIDGFVRVLTQECHILDERRHILSPLIQDPEIQAGLKAKLDKSRVPMPGTTWRRFLDKTWCAISHGFFWTTIPGRVA